MQILTQYNYEKTWHVTSEKDAMRMIEEEIGKEGVEGTWQYVLDAIKKGKTISVGSCRFRADA